MRRLKKILFRTFLTITIVAVLVIVFISPITKYLVEKYDEKYTGRQITMDWAYVNPFTGYVHFENVQIYEQLKDSVFFSSRGISANFAMLKLFSKTYEISEIRLNHPKGILSQKDSVLNIADLIKKFTPGENADTTGEPLHLSILGIKIEEGEFHYRENLIPINYFIKAVNIESSGKKWDMDTMAIRFAFLSGIGTGDIKGEYSMNFDDMSYRLAAVANKFDLVIIQQYLKQITNYGSFRANLDADIKTTGNFNDRENITGSGNFAINDFHFGKTPTEDFASFKKLKVSIHRLSPKNHIYEYDSISLNTPFIKYERYDYLDNIQTMFGADGSNIKAVKGSGKFNLVIEIAEYIKVLAKNLFRSDYKFDRIAVYNADIQYNDYTLNEKFSIALNPLTVTSDSVDKNRKRVKVNLHAGILPYGRVDIGLNINPKDSSDFELRYHLQKLPASLFNPYVITYTSFPLDRGTIEVNGTWTVRNGMIYSNNHLLIIDPRVTHRIKNKGLKWIPMRLIMAFIRERGNVIDYEIPISGNLKNPKFHWRDVILDAVKNVFVKPATTPYRIEIRKLETQIEKSLSLKWDMRNSTIEKDQQHFIKKMVSFLKENPDAYISVAPRNYTLKEKEYILLFEAKKKYFLSLNGGSPGNLRESDSIKINKMSIKDSMFIRYLNRNVNDSFLIFTVQDKCARIISAATIENRFNQLNQARMAAFMSSFRENGVEKQVKVYAAQTVVPYNGYSFFSINYKGEFPEYLLKAYRNMNDLNNEAPRKKFKLKRKKNKQ